MNVKCWGLWIKEVGLNEMEACLLCSLKWKKCIETTLCEIKNSSRWFESPWFIVALQTQMYKCDTHLDASGGTTCDRAAGVELLRYCSNTKAGEEDGEEGSSLSGRARRALSRTFLLLLKMEKLHSCCVSYKRTPTGLSAVLWGNAHKAYREYLQLKVLVFNCKKTEIR